MSDWEGVGRFLLADPRDAGCDETLAVLHIYVDQMVMGEDAAARYPGVAAHLLACKSCANDCTGLLTAAISE